MALLGGRLLPDPPLPGAPPSEAVLLKLGHGGIRPGLALGWGCSCPDKELWSSSLLLGMGSRSEFWGNQRHDGKKWMLGWRINVSAPWFSAHGMALPTSSLNYVLEPFFHFALRDGKCINASAGGHHGKRRGGHGYLWKSAQQ